MLLRRNWGRLLYLLYTPVQYVLMLFLTRFSLMQLPRLAVYIVFLILLTRPKVNAFFADRAGPPAHGNGDTAAAEIEQSADGDGARAVQPSAFR